MFFLSANGILYSSPVEDSWYAAHRATNISSNSTDGRTGHTLAYLSDEPASVLGCKMQYQKCDTVIPSKQGCSLLSGSNVIDFSVQSPITKKDQALYWRLPPAGVHDVVSELQSSSLTSKFLLNKGRQTTLPANQWQREVENWHNIALAAMQGGAVDDAVGPEDDNILKDFWTKPRNYVEKYLCKNQVRRDLL